MLITTNDLELRKEIEDYVKNQCDSKTIRCSARYKMDGCAWCYVEHLKEMNQKKQLDDKKEFYKVINCIPDFKTSKAVIDEMKGNK